MDRVIAVALFIPVALLVYAKTMTQLSASLVRHWAAHS